MHHRSIRYVLLGLALLLGWSASCVAQSLDTREDTSSLAQSATMPTWVVPVLRLVSATHVEPTTGVVISDTGLVLVPAGFASNDDEIIVLDGGTDIVRHGRTARLEREFFTQGVQVLRVSGLRRSEAPFADGELLDGAGVSLAAFPPAEQIAEGAAPLNTPATVVVFGESGNPAVSGETQLPNVTGALLDSCGNLAGYSMAHDVQSMQTHPGTRYKWRPALLAVLAELRLAPAPSACRPEPPPAQAEPEPEPEPQPETAPEPETPAEPEPDPEPDAEESTDPVEEQTQEEIGEEPAPEVLPPPDEVLELEILPPFEDHRRIEQKDRGSYTWIWLLLAAILIIAGILLHRVRKRLTGSAEGGQPADTVGIPPLSGEEEPPATPVLPEPEALLVLSGVRADGSAFEASCAVSENAVNVVIGRGAVDLRIDSLAVSRQHASLNGTAGALTLTDLGSNNGTTINGVPCLEGEIMYVNPGDTITLGDARFTFELLPPSDSTNT